MPQGSVPATDVRKRLAQLVRDAHTNVEIHGKLKGEFPETHPEIRWIEREAAKVRRRLANEDAEPWDFLAADVQECALVMPVLAAAIVTTGGRRRHLTGREARLAMRVRAVAGEAVDPGDVYVLARSAALDDEWRQALETYLAFAPWSDRGERYRAALREGWVTRWIADQHTGLDPWAMRTGGRLRLRREGENEE